MSTKLRRSPNRMFWPGLDRQSYPWCGIFADTWIAYMRWCVLWNRMWWCLYKDWGLCVMVTLIKGTLQKSVGSWLIYSKPKKSNPSTLLGLGQLPLTLLSSPTLISPPLQLSDRSRRVHQIMGFVIPIALAKGLFYWLTFWSSFKALKIPKTRKKIPRLAFRRTESGPVTIPQTPLSSDPLTNAQKTRRTQIKSMTKICLVWVSLLQSLTCQSTTTVFTYMVLNLCSWKGSSYTSFRSCGLVSSISSTGFRGQFHSMMKFTWWCWFGWLSWAHR